MMHRNALATLLVVAGLSSVGSGAYAGPLSASISLRDATPQNVETVQWRGGGWRRGGWGGWRGGGVGLGLGFAAGALIGSALAAPYYGGYGYYGDGYGYGYSPAYYGGYGYGGYWPGYRRRVFLRRPYWGPW
jgi:hypothetical protein